MADAASPAADAGPPLDLAPAGPTCVRLPGIIGWWDADAVTGTTAHDLSGNGNHGALVGGVPVLPGLVGNGFRFGEAGHAVEIPSAKILTPGVALTIEAWVNPDRQSTDWWRVAGKQADDQSGPSSYILGLSPKGTMYFGLFEGLQTFLEGATVVPPGKWSHLAGVWDGTTMRMYFNGKPEPQTAAFTGPPRGTELPLRLGKGDVNPEYLFHGMVDEVSLYDRALSEAEVASIVAAGALGKCKQTGNP
jgi:hypothetical protein